MSAERSTVNALDEPAFRYSRRGFLKRAGAGAGAVALSGGVGAAMAPRAVAARSATVSTSPTAFASFATRPDPSSLPNARSYRR